MTFESFTDRYRFDIHDPAAKVGEGGFGQVYKAYDALHHKWVAVKVASVQSDRENLSLRAEIEKARSLPDHPHIARYEACFRFRLPGGTFDYGVMQYYEMGNLRQLLAREHLDRARQDALARGILSALAFLHDHRILHRDLKSSNVLVTGYLDHRVPLVADFGLSKRVESDDSVIGNSIAGGSVCYTAPEQLMGEPLRFNADLWSFGVLLYELFTGELPYRPDTGGSATSGIRVYQAILAQPVPPGMDRLPQPWQEICRRCLVADPAVRVRSAAELLRLASAGDSERTRLDPHPEPAPEPLPPPASPAAQSRRRFRLLPAVLLLLLSGLAAWIAWPRTDAPIPVAPPRQLPAPPAAATRLREILDALPALPAAERLPFLEDSGLPALLADPLVYYYDFEGGELSRRDFLRLLAHIDSSLETKELEIDREGLIRRLELRNR